MRTTAAIVATVIAMTATVAIEPGITPGNGQRCAPACALPIENDAMTIRHLSAVLLLAATLAIPAFAGNTAAAVIGGAVGGGAGAAVGDSVGGRDGAILGGAIGGAAGAAIGANAGRDSGGNAPRRDQRRHRSGHDHHHDSGKHKGHGKRRKHHDD